MGDQDESQEQDGDMVEAVNHPVETDITHHVGWVFPAIQEILDANPALTFTCLDIYCACQAKAARLWTTDEGLVVTTGETDEFTGERTLLIWLAWARKRGTNLVAKHQDFFVQLARKEGYKKLETRSAVPDLKHHFLSQGWQIDTIVYTRDV